MVVVWVEDGMVARRAADAVGWDMVTVEKGMCDLVFMVEDEW